MDDWLIFVGVTVTADATGIACATGTVASLLFVELERYMPLCSSFLL